MTSSPIQMLIRLLALLSASNVHASDFSWLEGEWISLAEIPSCRDTDAGIELRTVVKHRWGIRDGMLRESQRCTNGVNSTYSISPINDGTFRLHLQNLSGHTGSGLITRTSDGFCFVLDDVGPMEPVCFQQVKGNERISEAEAESCDCEG